MWYKSQSAIKPDVEDSTSSKVYVYLRRNIEQITGENGEALYTYEEQIIPKADYATYLADKNSADLAYLYMMGGLDYE